MISWVIWYAGKLQNAIKFPVLNELSSVYFIYIKLESKCGYLQM